MLGLNFWLMAWCWGLFTELGELKLHWERGAESAVEKAVSLAELERAMGYGGFIHNFKNYVIRGTEDYRERTATSYRLTMEAMARLERQIITVEERRQLAQIKQTLEQYGDKFQQLQMLAGNNETVRERDQLVRVDDTEALINLEVLSRELIPGFVSSVTLSKARIETAWNQVYVGLGLVAFFLLLSIGTTAYYLMMVAIPRSDDN